MKFDKSVIALLLGGLLLRVIIAVLLYPGFDEAYYYLYTLHLNLSYFDHPPLVALATGFGPWLTGEVSQFTIRIGTLILHTGALILLYLTSARLFSAKAALLTLAIATIIPIFLVGFGVLTLPDSPLIFFWTASLYCAAWEFFDNRHEKYRPSYRLAILGLLVGLACLGKYHGFILGLGLVGFCLTSRYRSALTSAWTLLGLGLFLVTISPLLIWNIQHEWISFSFQSRRGIPSGEYELPDVVSTFLTGVAYLFPTLGLPLWWVSLRSGLEQIIHPYVKTRKKSLHPNPKSQDDIRQKQLLILWVSLPLIVGFTWLAGYRQILPTWSLPGFWAATILLGQQVVSWQKNFSRLVQRWLWGTAIAVISLLLFALLHLSIGTLQKPSDYALFGGFFSPQRDPSTQLFDIQQLRQGFADSPTLNSALQNSSFVFTNRYYLGGQIGMALAPLAKTPITTFDKDIRGFAFWSKPEQWLGKDGLYVTTDKFARRQELMDRYKPYFKTVENIGSIPIERGGEVIQVFQVYQTKTLLKPYPRPYGAIHNSQFTIQER